MKQNQNELAIFGGPPTFKEQLHVGRPNIGNRERLLERINTILDRKWLSNNGRCIQEFEQRIAEKVGVKHCIAICNGTIALQLAIKALGLTGEVIIPSMTFIATAHALQWQHITPVFCDIDPKSYNLDPLKVEKLITPKTTGILGVHLYGRPCDTDALTAIAHMHQLKLMFDAAHAFSCSHKGRMVGGFGDAEIFSFHATKFFNTFEGGAIVTNDDNLDGKIRLMKNFGFAGYDKVAYIGINGKMNEISAAMGLTGLDSLDEFVEVNYQNYKKYKQELEDIPGIQLMPYDETERCNYQYIVLTIDERNTTISRDELVKILHAENILARRYYYPGCHKMEPYYSTFPNGQLTLPETEKLAKQVLVLPTGTAVGEEDIANICQIIRLALS